MKKYNAFTLAEVLITLGIIGVVAALTMPSLIQKHQEKVTVTRLKQAYSQLSQAYLMSTENNGNIDNWEFTSTNMSSAENHALLANKFVPYLKISKNCIGLSENEVFNNCFASDTFKKAEIASTIVLANGIRVGFRSFDGKKCASNYGGENKYLSNICGLIAVDVNNNKKESIAGKSKFNFYITKHGIYPQGAADDKIAPIENLCTKTRTFNRVYESGYRNGDACTAWVLYNENMDYLHCDDLSWNGKHKCK